MRKVYRSLIAVFCIVVFPTVILFAEGTKELMPTTSSKGQLCINKYRNDFAFYNAAPEFRLTISIANSNETIKFGFGKLVSANTTGLVYRIKDPAGIIVLPQAAVPVSGKGFIYTYAEALAGPLPASGGYDYEEFHPGTPGDYYLEFYYPPEASGAYIDNSRRILEFFDITVADAVGKPINGRVWSKAWQFWSGSDSHSTIDRFYGKMMILSDDSIVTQVDCNGFRGGSFSFSSNMTGCDATSIQSNDRMSRVGFHTYPQYKVFLNDPDNILFPTQKLPSGVLTPILVTPECDGSADFGIKVDKDCTVKLLIDINPGQGADPEDVQIIENVKANPGISGYNIIHWDGNDNYGRPVANGKTLTFTVTNLSGLTHLPIYDIENNDYGYIVRQIRPAGGSEPMKIYWDDTQIAGGTANTSSGCNSTSGCHPWNNDFGNNNTINSWWFVTGSIVSSTPFFSKRTPGAPTISGKNVHCVGEGTLEFSVSAEPNSTRYKWSYSGKGVTLETSGLTAKLTFSATSTPGDLSVSGENDSCGAGPKSIMNIVFEPLPKVVLEPFPDMCYTLPGFRLSGGTPLGGTYYIDGEQADSLYPYKEPEGIYAIAYYYTSPVGCSNSDSASILLYNSPDCDGTIFFPDAFTPDGNSVNDNFRPVAENIFSFKMNIYNRWGQLVYTAEDVDKGWDGTCMGEQCPSGTYTYVATYAPSLRTDESKTKKGAFTLIR